MSFASLLAQIRKEKQSKVSDGLSSGARDPAVERLKQARLAEKEINKPAKVKSKAPRATKSSQPTRATQTSRQQPPKLAEPARRPTQPPAKKLKFSELMKQAKKVDTQKLATLPTLTKKASPTPPGRRPLRETREPVRVKDAAAVSFGKPREPARRSKKEAPVPFARPSEEVLKKIQKRKASRPSQRRGLEEDDDDLEDFVEYDEDGQIADAGYDRDEIWNMFGGRKRAYDDYDDSEDDMEATGAEVLEEEERSTRTARLEDERERRLLEQREAEKRRRKLQNR